MLQMVKIEIYCVKCWLLVLKIKDMDVKITDVGRNKIWNYVNNVPINVNDKSNNVNKNSIML